MILLAVGVAIATLVTTLLLLLAGWGVRLVRGRVRWRRVWIAAALLIPLHAFGTVPAVLGVAAARFLVHTRGDESDYAGPELDDQGHWRTQGRGHVLPGPSPYAISLTAADGVRLRAFAVPPPGAATPRAVVVLAHGLFRGGLELDPVAADFHALGCHVVMVELRNHGGSGRAVATFGRDERLDVRAAVDWVRARQALRNRPLVLFGVSLGTAAVMFAAAEIEPPPDALVLDSPIDDVRATADRMLGEGPRGRAALGFPEPFRALVLDWLELAAGVDLASPRPIDALRGMAPVSAALVVGGELDRRTPPDVARAVFAAVPVRDAADEQLWIRPGSGHGDVWRDDPAGYRARLEWLLGRLPGR